MVANEKARTENVRWELSQMATRLPEEWRKWKFSNLSRMACVKRLTRVLGTEAFHPLRGLVILTSWAEFAPGEQFLMNIPGAPAEFLCQIRFARRSPAGTWTLGTQILGEVHFEAQQHSGRFAA